MKRSLRLSGRFPGLRPILLVVVLLVTAVGAHSASAGGGYSWNKGWKYPPTKPPATYAATLPVIKAVPLGAAYAKDDSSIAVCYTQGVVGFFGTDEDCVLSFKHDGTPLLNAPIAYAKKDAQGHLTEVGTLVGVKEHWAVGYAPFAWGGMASVDVELTGIDPRTMKATHSTGTLIISCIDTGQDAGAPGDLMWEGFRFFEKGGKSYSHEGRYGATPMNEGFAGVWHDIATQTVAGGGRWHVSGNLKHWSWGPASRIWCSRFVPPMGGTVETTDTSKPYAENLQPGCYPRPRWTAGTMPEGVSMLGAPACDPYPENAVADLQLPGSDPCPPPSNGGKKGTKKDGGGNNTGGGGSALSARIAEGEGRKRQVSKCTMCNCGIGMN